MKSFTEWRVPDSAIHIDLPDVTQQKEFSCGAACLRSICQYFKVGEDAEKDYIKSLKATSKDGTSPEEIVKCSKDWGLLVKSQENMSIEKLIDYVEKKVPVICAIQAWGKPKYYERKESGHYVIAIGFDDKNIYFMDPYIQERGALEKGKFMERWEDTGKDGKVYKQLGIAIWKREPDKEIQKKHKVKKIK